MNIENIKKELPGIIEYVVIVLVTFCAIAALAWVQHLDGAL